MTESMRQDLGVVCGNNPKKNGCWPVILGGYTGHGPSKVTVGNVCLESFCLFDVFRPDP